MPTIPLTRTPPQTPLRISLSAAASSSSLPNFQFSLFNFKPKKFHFFKPLSSLRETKKQKTPSNAPQSLRTLLNFNPKGGNDEGTDGETGGGGDEGSDTAVKGTILAGLLLVGAVGGFGSLGYIYKDQISAFLTQFSVFIEGKFQTTISNLLILANYCGKSVANFFYFSQFRSKILYFSRFNIMV